MTGFSLVTNARLVQSFSPLPLLLHSDIRHNIEEKV